jgi:hypothetical protein
MNCRARVNLLLVPLDNARVFPTARSHIVARNLVGIPLHQSFRIAGLRWTILQSGKISFSHMCSDCSILSSLASRRSCNAFLRFSSYDEEI